MVNVVARDSNRNNIYGASFGAEFEGNNQLGPAGTKLDTWMLPYGVVYGPPLKQGESSRLFEFSLLNGAQFGKFDQERQTENEKSIALRLFSTIRAYNQQAAQNEKDSALQR